MHRTNVNFLTNKVHNCEYSQVYNMTENLTFERYFENNCVQRACFREFHSIHSRVYQFYMYTFSMHIDRTRSSLETRYQKVEEISIIVAQTIGNFKVPSKSTIQKCISMDIMTIGSRRMYLECLIRTKSAESQNKNAN